MVQLIVHSISKEVQNEYFVRNERQGSIQTASRQTTRRKTTKREHVFGAKVAFETAIPRYAASIHTNCICKKLTAPDYRCKACCCGAADDVALPPRHRRCGAAADCASSSYKAFKRVGQTTSNTPTRKERSLKR